MTDELRYPVGRFAPPTDWDDATRTRCRTDLAELPARLRRAIGGLDDAQLDTPYRDGGWTVRQVVHHLADSHLNMYCRVRLAMTEESPTIKPYIEARWAELPDARTLPVDPSMRIIDGVHARLDALIESFTAADWQRTFVHPEQQRSVTLSHTAAMYAWHSRHHVAHITGLRTRRGW